MYRTPSANVNHLERVASVLTGAALLIHAYQGRRRPMNTITGVGLVARGLTGYCPVNSLLGRGRSKGDTRDELGGDSGVLIEESVLINRPASDLYRFWRQLENLPGVFSHLTRVTMTSPRTSHWVVEGPAGTSFEWDAEIINNIKDELIAWRSLPGSDIASAGSVSFDAHGRSTEVTVRMQYDVPGGKAASALAWLAGMGPSKVVREELERFKERFESSSSSLPFNGWTNFDAPPVRG